MASGGTMSHCPTCRCEEEAFTLVLPMNYFPPGYDFLIEGGETFITNPRRDIDYYWTNRWKRDTEGYKAVRFENQEDIEP
jgi:hypothetical protein